MITADSIKQTYIAFVTDIKHVLD